MLSRMRGVDEVIETLERAENRIDVPVVRDVITEVMHWRGKDRRNPDRIHAKPDEVVQSSA